MEKSNIMIRLEKKEEQQKVENLVRESFWNVYRPGCLEHYVLHKLRNDPAFVPELDFVMLKDGKLIGQNMFMKAVIVADDDRSIPIMTMGPICIAPELKRKGYGKILLDYSLEKAKELLMCSDKRTSDIGYEVGYKDSHYFSYIFKKTQGCSPKEFRSRGRG